MSLEAKNKFIEQMLNSSLPTRKENKIEKAQSYFNPKMPLSLHDLTGNRRVQKQGLMAFEQNRKMQEAEERARTLSNHLRRMEQNRITLIKNKLESDQRRKKIQLKREEHSRELFDQMKLQQEKNKEYLIKRMEVKHFRSAQDQAIQFSRRTILSQNRKIKSQV